jgi:hypothetical protein
MTHELLYEPENEIEAQAIIGMLESEDVAVVALRRSDTAYPGIGHAGWGRLLVAAADLARAQDLLADYLEAELESPHEFEEPVPAESVSGPYRTSARPHRTLEPKRMLRNTAGVGGALVFVGSLGLNAYFLLDESSEQERRSAAGDRSFDPPGVDLDRDSRVVGPRSFDDVRGASAAEGDCRVR